ncbi:aminoglycoside phosphotransferase [Fusarium beomiforme]|uniref:Aminoglycoside phosphotransferase n=1 Tax=Fusarium beomiforme TaxID=44412 RepID=A0A9P5E1E7_9HYPO|nr:aminoglycoside phosphotransferase [Fusarium beomiforme]
MLGTVAKKTEQFPRHCVTSVFDSKPPPLILSKPVKDVIIEETIHGTASKILVTLTLYGDMGASSISACVKGSFNPKLNEALPFLSGLYRREAEFYHYIAPRLNIALPDTWYVGTDTTNGQGIVIMGNLKVQGCSFTNPLKPWPINLVEMAIEQLASLHASTWGSRVEDIPCANKNDTLVDPIVGLLATEEWNKRFADDARPPVPKAMDDRERIISTFKALWDSDTRLRCLVHGDGHIGNTFISHDGQPGFLDWQVTHVGSAMHDDAYFINALHLTGGPDLQLQLSGVWEEYRRHTFHGFAWVLAGPMMQSREVVDVMVERHCAAIIDHQSMELLEGCEE